MQARNTLFLPLIIFFTILLAIGGFIFYQASQDTTGSMEKSGETMQKPIDAMESEDSMEKTDGMKESSYVPYTPEAFTSASSNKRVLFFYANWCPTCRPADADIQANAADIPSDVTVIRVNYNDTDTDPTEKELASTYGVTYQHTYIQIDSEGSVVTKWNGGQFDELLANLK